ncbi:MAG: lytic transglycosylase domain-containing protein [Acidobacteriota bacterium]
MRNFPTETPMRLVRPVDSLRPRYTSFRFLKSVKRTGVVMSLAVALLVTLTSSAWAGSLYSYINERGVRVYTNIGTNRTDLPREKSGSSTRRVSNPYLPLIHESARQFNVDADLVQAVIQVESHFNPRAVSPKGCIGLMQLHPDTARRFGVKDAYDPAQNIQGGVRYLRFLTDHFNGELPLVLAAYNAGENAVIRHQGIPPYRETQQYVRKVTALYESLKPAAETSESNPPLTRVVLPNGSVLFTTDGN